MASWVTLAVVFATVLVLVRDLFSPALTILGAVVMLLVAGVVTPAEAFSGFSNAAPITVAALYVIAGAVEKTGALQPLVELTLGRAHDGRGSMGRLLLPTGAVSGFLNNTPIVAMLAPQVSAWAERRGVSASKYLMPLSFATILGGMTTLIGTSTNLVVSGLMQTEGLAPLGMFELTTVGLPVAAAGLLFLVLFSRRLLPDRRGARQQAEEEARSFTVGMRVVRGGALDGMSVEAGGLRHLQGVFLVEVQRATEVIAPVRPETVLRGGDRLTFVGRADQVLDLQRSRGLISAEQDHLLRFDLPGHTFFEAVIGEASSLVGNTLRDTEFRGRYQAAVLAIHRAGQRVESKLGSVRLKVGDTLLILADPGFATRWRDRSDFLLVSRRGGSPPMRTSKATGVGLVVLGVVVLAGAGVLPILESALLGAIALIALGILTPAEARASVDLDVIVVIAAAFGLGAAIESSGLATMIGDLIVGVGGGFGRVGALAGVVLAVILLTELITNNAAAALMFPIAIATARAVDADPRAFAIAVAIAASASFLTPIGYQTNTMVYGMGGYRFGDFARLGVALTLIVFLVLVVWIGMMGVY
ncbi:MAG: SLC13 family permease [Longimicrobiales bacterium]